MKIEKIMTKDVITLAPDATIMDAVTTLAKHGISGAPVVNAHGSMVGIVTEYDIMKRLIEYYIPSYMSLLANVEVGGSVGPKQVLATLDVTAKDIMTKEVISVHADDDAVEAARLITKHDINPLPVVDREKKLVGVVSRSDIVKYAIDVFSSAPVK